MDHPHGGLFSYLVGSRATCPAENAHAAADATICAHQQEWYHGSGKPGSNAARERNCIVLLAKAGCVRVTLLLGVHAMGGPFGGRLKPVIAIWNCRNE